MPYSKSSQRLIIAITLALVAFNAGLDLATGFSRDHWRESVAARF